MSGLGGRFGSFVVICLAFLWCVGVFPAGLSVCPEVVCAVLPGVVFEFFEFVWVGFVCVIKGPGVNHWVSFHVMVMWAPGGVLLSA